MEPALAQDNDIASYQNLSIAFTIHPLPLLVVFEATNSALFLPQKGRVVIRQALFDPIGRKNALQDKKLSCRFAAKRTFIDRVCSAPKGKATKWKASENPGETCGTFCGWQQG